ncbi:MAG: electron transport complex subunit RsxC [Alkalispirochaeta sp.]
MAHLTFKKGVHPPSHKSFTERRPIERMPVGDALSVPLTQHLGVPATPVVRKGDRVEVGDLLGDASKLISARIHSPAAGTVKRIVDQPLPGGKLAQYVEITVDREATEQHTFSETDVDLGAITREQILETMRTAGVVGMGGATFPTDVKFSPMPDKSFDVLVINGAECEPYLTCDHRVMVEETEALMDGCRLLHKTYGFKAIYIAIEANKPDAINAFEDVVAVYSDLPIKVASLTTKYPQGAEKTLIRTVTGRIIPTGKLPLDVGAVVCNVQTLFAIYEAVHFGKPVIERVVTVSGAGIESPKNIRAMIGTPLDRLVEYCGGITESVNKVVAGGPMTGMALPTLDYSVSKGSSGFLFLTNADVEIESPCIKCGRCVAVCPMNLMPLKLAAFSRAGRFSEAQRLAVNSCFECGSCSFVCPAKINIVAYVRHAKHHIRVHGSREDKR